MAYRFGLAFLCALGADAGASGGGPEQFGPAGAALEADGAACGMQDDCPAISALQHDAARHHRRGTAGASSSDVPDGLSKFFARLVSAYEYVETQTSIKANEHLPAEDPFWAQARAKLKAQIYKDPDSKEYMDFCRTGDLEGYLAKGCAPTAGGSSIVRGVAADAFYCGRTEGVDWSSIGGKPHVDLCNVPLESAYKPGGLCSVGDKQLLLNYIYRGPAQWGSDPTTINVPSVDCIMDIGDCDLYYCQKCAGRCNPH